MASSSMPSFGDPYDLIGVDPDASDADISKAYRKLALKLHPDKQQNKTELEKEKMAKLFHDVKEARSFLMEPEHADARRKYKLKRVSEKLRRQQDALREKGMSDRRKRMRDELAKKEQGANRKKQNTTEADQDLLERLRKEGSQARERHASQKAREQHKQEAKERKSQKAALENKQIRLKWSRSRMETSPSEHSLAELLSKFGVVETVEMIGSKGNSALVTFKDAGSCRPCVDAYLNSEEMRASFVGKRKEREEALQRNGDQEPPPVRRDNRQDENLEERVHRQAAEREALLRQMEMEDMGKERSGLQPKLKPKSRNRKDTKFPPAFPLDTTQHENLQPFELLEQLERSVFKGTMTQNNALQ